MLIKFAPFQTQNRLVTLGAPTQDTYCEDLEADLFFKLVQSKCEKNIREISFSCFVRNNNFVEFSDVSMPGKNCRLSWNLYGNFCHFLNPNIGWYRAIYNENVSYKHNLNSYGFASMSVALPGVALCSVLCKNAFENNLYYFRRGASAVLQRNFSCSTYQPQIVYLHSSISQCYSFVTIHCRPKLLFEIMIYQQIFLIIIWLHPNAISISTASIWDLLTVMYFFHRLYLLLDISSGVVTSGVSCASPPQCSAN